MPPSGGAAPVLVIDVVGAQRVAVDEQRPYALDLVHGGVGEEARAGRFAEALAEEEIAVAVHEVQRHAAGGEPAQQSGHHGVERPLEVVVADPVLEEVAQDVERLGGARLSSRKSMKRSFAAGRSSVRCRSEMKSEGTTSKPRYYFFAPTTVTDSISTGCVGTSLRKGPAGPVGVFAIFVTTSMPETTFPNTA